MTRRKRILKTIGKVFLILLVIGIVVHTVASFVLERRLKAEIAKIKASGAPIDYTELGKPKVPDSENAAVIYAKVFKDLTGLVLNPTGGSAISNPRMPNEDLDAIERFVDAAPGERSPEMWALTQEVVAKYKHLIPMIEEAASRPKCQFTVNWEDGVNALFPHYAPMREIARLLHVNTLIQARDGRMDEAAHSIGLGFKASESLKDEQTLIGQLVRIAMIKIASKSLRESLVYGNINEAQAKRLHDVLAKIDMYPGFNKAMQGERCSSLWIFDLLLNQPEKFIDMVHPEVANNKIALRFQRMVNYQLRPFRYASEMFSLNYWERNLEVMRLPYREMHSQIAALDIENRPIPFYARTLAAITCPVFVRATSTRDDASVEVAGSQIILALQVYKGRYGSYPATLDDLRTKLGWDIPKDVYSNRDFIYKRQWNGFLLYSIGNNLKDDGTISSTKRPAPEGYDYPRNGKYYADIVWQMAD